MITTQASQTAREMGINRPEVILQKVDAIPGLSEVSRERRLRNYERTWLYVFIADKSFGIATGRPMCVSWKELMPDVGNWWRNRGTTTADRLICGVAEMRLIVVSTARDHLSVAAGCALTLCKGESIRSPPDVTQNQSIHPLVAERELCRCLAPPNLSLLLHRCICTSDVSRQFDLIFLPGLLPGSSQLLRFARPDRTGHGGRLDRIDSDLSKKSRGHRPDDGSDLVRS